METILREWRKGEGMTIKEVADLVKCDPAIISKVERHVMLPARGLAWELAELTGIHVLHLIYPERYDSRGVRIGKDQT